MLGGYAEEAGLAMDASDTVAARDGSRIHLASEPPLRLGPLLVEPALRRIVHADGREDVLEPRVMQVLVALARSDGGIVSRGDLLAACWHGVVVGEDAIDRVIGRLRRVGEAYGFTIATVTKVGYRLIVADAPAPAEASRHSVCVLPFANMSDDPQQEYFSDGITEDIITDLSKVSRLFVTARTTAFSLRGKDLDIPAIARQLNVAHVLEGSVRKAAGRVRITAQLVDGATGGHVWAERYDRELQDIFALQDEISQAIVRALQLKLLPAEKEAIAQRETSDPEAYDLYLMARRYYGSGHAGEERELDAIVRICRRATELDPAYARAWALMAHAQAQLRFSHGRPGDGGRAAAERALALEPDRPEAHAVRARQLWVDGQPDAAWAESETALRLGPDCWEANTEAARICYLEHRFEEAVRFYEKALTLCDGAGGAGMLMSSYHALGDEAGARRAAEMLLAHAERALVMDHIDVSAMACAVGACVVLKKLERARSLMERGLLMAPDNMTLRYNFACGLSTYLHDVEGALGLLEAVFPTLSPAMLEHAKRDPDFEPLRDDPRFQAMVAAAEARLAGETAPI
jgi:adenylate cyclase